MTRLKKALSMEDWLDRLETVIRDHHGDGIVRLDVRGLTTVADHFLIASGTSDRQLRTLAERIREAAFEAGRIVVGSEGERTGGWILVDLDDVIVHLMLPDLRRLYQLEKLWGWSEPVEGLQPDG
jgi:ribosome-associated protein